MIKKKTVQILLFQLFIRIEDGSIVSWGWNEHGNCGNGSVEDVKYPNFVKISKSMRGTLIGTGYGHSFALVKKLI